MPTLRLSATCSYVHVTWLMHYYSEHGATNSMQTQHSIANLLAGAEVGLGPGLESHDVVGDVHVCQRQRLHITTTSCATARK